MDKSKKPKPKKKNLPNPQVFLKLRSGHFVLMFQWSEILTMGPNSQLRLYGKRAKKKKTRASERNTLALNPEPKKHTLTLKPE